MKFCPKCGTLILPKKSADGGAEYTCTCGYSEVGETTKMTSDTKAKEVAEIILPAGSEDERLPTCEEDCENESCDSKEAYYWEIQTRASDEPPTRFFKCTKCNHTWRDYS